MSVQRTITLSEADDEFLQLYVEMHPGMTRSGAIRDAVGLLKAAELEEAFRAAFAEWSDSQDADMWERTVGDGFAGTGDARRLRDRAR